jgi:hypothetical protein
MVYIHGFSNVSISILFFLQDSYFSYFSSLGLELWLDYCNKIYNIWFVHNVSTYLLSYTQETIEHNLCIPTMQYSYFPLNMQLLKMYFQWFVCTFGFILIYVCKLAFPSNFSYKGYSSIFPSFMNISHAFSLGFYFHSQIIVLFFNFHKRMQLETIWSNKLYQP